jgi:hypothetical protein
MMRECTEEDKPSMTTLLFPKIKRQNTGHSRPGKKGAGPAEENIGEQQV